MPTAFNVAKLLKGKGYAEFTSGEQSCISGKISKLRDEGKPMDQAIAIAIETCAPGKAQKNAAYQNDGDFEIPGGDYTAEQNADGTWNILDIEIYAAHTRRLPDGFRDGKLQYRVIKVGNKWLAGALSHHQVSREAGKFLYPLHINHHEYCGGSSNQPVKGSSFFMPTRIGKGVIDGEETEILYANFLGISPEVFAKIERKELAYRSAEILNINETIVSSVSVMEHDVPFFPFPLLTIGKKVPHPQAPPAPEVEVETDTQFAAAMQSAVAYSKHTEGGNMPDEKDKDKEANQGDELSVADMFKAIMEVMKGLVAGKGGGEEAEPSRDDDDDKDKPGEERPVEVPSQDADKDDDKDRETAALHGDDEKDKDKDKNKVAARAAGMEGKFDVLKARLDKRDTHDVLRHKARGWAVELAAYNLGSDVETKLFNKAVKEGEAAALAYVEAVKETGTKMPSDDYAPGAAPLGTEFPKEVMAYAKGGPDELARADAAYHNFEEAKDFGLVDPSMTREQWIKTQMKAGHNVPAK